MLTTSKKTEHHPLPSSDLDLNMNNTPYQSASAFIEKEMGMTDTEIPDPDDMGLIQSLVFTLEHSKS